MAPNLVRLTAAAHYVIARTEPHELGATKLNKILWFSDLESYRETGKTITGLTEYVRMPKGPVPDGISRSLNDLKKLNRIYERQSKVYTYTRREFVWLKEPDISMFSAQEIDTLNVYIDIIKKQPAEYISDVTHDALWKGLNNGDPMPIGAGSIVPRTPTPEELEWAEAQAAE